MDDPLKTNMVHLFLSTKQRRCQHSTVIQKIAYYLIVYIIYGYYDDVRDLLQCSNNHDLIVMNESKCLVK